MCGIAGIHAWGARRFEPAIVQAMTECLAHRGPDDAGYTAFSGPGARPATWRPGEPAPPAAARTALGNRRLKIVDLSTAGHQPMTDGTRWVAYNGEIYNHVELRRELDRIGYAFTSSCDTEVVLHAFDAWGTDCFARFNGMWAIAIYDPRDGSLVLSRDRFGVKPLYVHRGRDELVFGSEIKALLRHPAVPRDPDLGTIYNYVARHYRWVDGGARSFYAGIEHFPKGHWWRIDAEGKVTERRFWALDASRLDESLTDEEALERFRETFCDAVAIRLRADVPVATLLSGGLDSGSVTAVAAQLSGAPVTTFSARFEEEGYDEGRWIQALTRDVGADARFIRPRAAELIPTLERMLDFHDEPVCTATWFVHWLIMEQVAGQGFPVILNGHVGDELFAGYWDHYLYNLADLEDANPARFESEYAAWRRNHGRSPGEYERRREALRAGLRPGEASQDAARDHAAVASPELRAAAPPSDRPNPYGSRDRLRGRLHQELMYETVPAVLRPEDRNSMAFAIESRSPFLDYRLVELAFAMPGRFKIRDGLGKWAIREGMKGTLEESVRTRHDKQGLVAPTAHWFRGASHDAVREVLASSELAERGLLAHDEVLRSFDAHVSGAEDHYLEIWQWLNLELWMRQAFDGSTATTDEARTLRGAA
jgi:asparagine synthase (glutamine-hydrolysing)